MSGQRGAGKYVVEMNNRSTETLMCVEPVGASRCLVSVSRFQNHRNLQLCFINNSDSEDDEEGTNKKVTFFKECSNVDLKSEISAWLNKG